MMIITVKRISLVNSKFHNYNHKNHENNDNNNKHKMAPASGIRAPDDHIHH